jgi:Uma2 family endonuclease
MAEAAEWSKSIPTPVHGNACSGRIDRSPGRTDNPCMSVLIHDAGVETQVRAARGRSDASRWDEAWNGVLVMPPTPNNEHQRLVMKLCSIFSSLVDWDAGDCCLPGANVSDRDVDWQFNYRVPDVFVALASGTAQDRGTHWIGPPDLLVEILSPTEEPYSKLDFYTGIGVRELLILHRDPWRLERFMLQNAVLARAGRCDPAGGEISLVTLPLTFRFRTTGSMHVESTNGQVWTV